MSKQVNLDLDAVGTEVGALKDKEIVELAKLPDGVMATMAALSWAGATMAYQFTRSPNAHKQRLYAMCSVALNIARSYQRLHDQYVQALDESHALRAENDKLRGI